MRLSPDRPRLPSSDDEGLDRMFLHGIEVHGRHGVFDFERRAGQRFVVDVDWWLATGAAVASDRLDATLCYKRLHDRVVAIIAGEPWSLIETLADALVRTLLAEFAAIEIVRVTVHKPDAPIGGTFADVGITMTRRRPIDRDGAG
ncbi:dihydroneopterin aldolase [Rhizorhabdus wittichii]|uniref:7,8-dihydroneopterin aldolase n=1 Tax=Rhizorhabdus wittichii TaxID=160791 RepID=A0A975HEB8_9SPHN|nr:dihydroneopterin aldolase [Rhizorhabdus wittichii]QTH22198.1 dihydroneopterin aldolase [Rhizorhabdus wittichii]